VDPRYPSLLHPPREGWERDLFYMSMALAEAMEAGERGEVPVGCVIVIDDEIIARASNRVEELEDPTAHAEMLAITSACEQLGQGRLSGCELFCTLEPCFMCAGALTHGRIQRLVFGARDPKFGACGSLADLPHDERLNHRYEVVEGVLANECAAVLQDFFRARRRQPGPEE
jgi:tRNA(adenine34) deaminase